MSDSKKEMDKNINIKNIEEQQMPKLSDIKKNKGDKIFETVSMCGEPQNSSATSLVEVLKIWKKERKYDLILKIGISVVLTLLVSGQVIFLMNLLYKIGEGKLKYNEWTLRLFVTSIFLEVVAMFRIVVSHLFPKNGSKDMIEFIQKSINQ